MIIFLDKYSSAKTNHNSQLGGVRKLLLSLNGCPFNSQTRLIILNVGVET